MTDSTLFSLGFGAALLLYAIGILFFCFRLIFDKKTLAIVALRFTVSALLIHLTFFLTHLIRQGSPYIQTSFDTYQIVSVGIILLYLGLSFSHRFIATGIILIPLSFLFYILSLTHIISYHLPGHILENPWAFVHLVFIFIALTIFIISFVTGTLYLVRDYRFRHKKFGGFVDRLPALDVMDLIHYKALYIAFVCFTVGIITGGGWSKSVSGYYISNDFKQLFSMAVWLFFALFLGLRSKRGWVGRRGILLSSVGLVAILFLFSWVQN